MNEPTLNNPAKKASRSAIVSWCLFDFANSSFTTVVVTVVFAVYFDKVCANGKGEQLWNLGQFLSNLLIFLTAPVVGAIADQGRGKKGFLLFSFILCIVTTAALFFARDGQVVFALSFFIIAYLAFSWGENLLAGFLPDLANSEDMGRISSYGWATGYVGGLLSLGICLPIAMKGWDYVPYTNLVVAAFFFVGGLPLFFFVHETRRPNALGLGESARAGLAQLRETWRRRRELREFSKFLTSYLFFNIGIYGVIGFAGLYAVKLYGFSSDDTIKIFIATQITAGAGALISGWSAKRFGCVRTIGWTLLVWMAACVTVFITRTQASFWFVAVLAGLAMGSSLPAARAAVGRFTPPEQSGEFFGLWGQVARLAAILGTAGHQLVLYLTNDLRAGIAFFGASFVVGWLLLKRVNEAAGVREAAR